MAGFGALAVAGFAACAGGPAGAGVILGTSAGAPASQYLNIGKQFPSVGQFLGSRAGGAFAASGVVIDDHWVLTAGHVTVGATGFRFYLDNGGGFDSFASRPYVTGDAWYTHPSYTGDPLAS